MKQLPKDWQRKALAEEARIGKGKYLVRMTGMPSVQPRVLQGLIEEAVGTEVHRVQITSQGATIHCGDLSTQTKVMGLAGNTLHDQVIKCTMVDPTLSGDKLADFVNDRLQMEQKLLALQHALGDVPKTRNVNQIQT